MLKTEIFSNYWIFFPESIPSVGLFVHVPIVAVKQMSIILYYFLQPLLFVYNITLLTANI